MKEVLKKISEVLKTIFGYGIMICLFAGGLTFFGYVVALIIGGDTAALMCTVIYKKIVPIIIYCSTCLVLLGIAAMYLSGEKALTGDKKKNTEKQELEEAGEQ